ncbi:hypothetical protein ACWCQW_47385 [Streptomyces mirabilis]
MVFAVAVPGTDIDAATDVTVALRAAVERDTATRWDAENDPLLTALSALEMGAEGWGEVEQPFFGPDAERDVRAVAERLNIGLTWRLHLEDETCCEPPWSERLRRSEGGGDHV